MLRSTKHLEHYALLASDGPIGEAQDFYFDDDAWTVRYLVVDTGTWLSSRRVLISPIALQRPEWRERVLPVSLTKTQVRHSPEIDTDKPVSRQHEAQMLSHYGYPDYWGGEALWGAGLYPYALVPGYIGEGGDRLEREPALEAYLRLERERHRNDDPHLRSCRAVTGYHIAATDGEIGHVADFLVDDETWAIRYLVIDTSNWWLGHQALIAPQWIKSVNWGEKTVAVDLSRDAIKSAPPYDPVVGWSREHEMALYGHYRRNGYWAGQPSALAAL